MIAWIQMWWHRRQAHTQYPVMSGATKPGIRCSCGSWWASDGGRGR